MSKSILHLHVTVALIKSHFLFLIRYCTSRGAESIAFTFMMIPTDLLLEDDFKEEEEDKTVGEFQHGCMYMYVNASC